MSGQQWPWESPENTTAAAGGIGVLALLARLVWPVVGKLFGGKAGDSGAALLGSAAKLVEQMREQIENLTERVEALERDNERLRAELVREQAQTQELKREIATLKRDASAPSI
jgi:TolA-binding protein